VINWALGIRFIGKYTQDTQSCGFLHLCVFIVLPFDPFILAPYFNNINTYTASGLIITFF
jgi:hypothetical protein